MRYSRERTFKFLGALFASSFFLLAFGLAGEADIQEAEYQEQAYCERVIQGVHSNYKDILRNGS